MSETVNEHESTKADVVRHVHHILESLKACHQPILDEYAEIERDPTEALHEIFRTSFKLSAGSPILQTLLQVRAADLLESRFEERESYEAFLDETVFDYESFTIPKRHTLLRPHRVEGRTRALWDFYIDVCRDDDGLSSLTPRDTIRERELKTIRVFGSSDLLPLNIAYFMAQRELVYMKNGRPNRPDDISRHKSFIRECGLEGKPTGCLEMDVVMREVGAYIASLISTDAGELPELYIFKQTKKRIDTTAELWESLHPGRKFL